MSDEVLWKPDQKTVDSAQVTRYQHWLAETRGLVFDDYPALWQWSVDNLDEFWRSIWEYYDIQPGQRVGTVLEDASMPGAKWFPGVEVNYVCQVFRHSTPERPAIVFQDENSAIIPPRDSPGSRVPGPLPRAQPTARQGQLPRVGRPDSVPEG